MQKFLNMIFTRFSQSFPQKTGGITNYGFTKSFTQKRFSYQFQEYIRQHKYCALFNENSLNTVRINTYRSVINEEIIIMETFLRMGGKDSLVDNLNAGGLMVRIFPDGKIQDFALDKNGKRANSSHPKGGLIFSEIGPVPHFYQICEMAKKISKNYHYFRILGFDFCIQEDGKIRLIEINFSGIGENQILCGSLFGDYTDEVIDYCLKEND